MNITLGILSAILIVAIGLLEFTRQMEQIIMAVALFVVGLGIWFIVREIKGDSD